MSARDVLCEAKFYMIQVPLPYLLPPLSSFVAKSIFPNMAGNSGSVKEHITTKEFLI